MNFTQYVGSKEIDEKADEVLKLDILDCWTAENYYQWSKSKCFCPEILCRKSRFDSWQDTLPLIDRTSPFLDIMLLQKLSSFLLLDLKRLQLV